MSEEKRAAPPSPSRPSHAPPPSVGSDHELETIRLERAKLEHENLKLQQALLEQQKAMIEQGKPPNAAEAETKILAKLEAEARKHLDELAQGEHKYWCHLDGQLPAGRRLHEPWLLVGAAHPYAAIEKYKDYMGIVAIGPPDNGEEMPKVQVVPFGSDERPVVRDTVHVVKSREEARELAQTAAATAARRAALAANMGG